MDDEEIIELFFKRSEQGIAELDRKYGGLCRCRRLPVPFAAAGGCTRG